MKITSGKNRTPTEEFDKIYKRFDYKVNLSDKHFKDYIEFIRYIEDTDYYKKDPSKASRFDYNELYEIYKTKRETELKRKEIRKITGEIEFKRKKRKSLTPKQKRIRKKKAIKRLKKSKPDNFKFKKGVTYVKVYHKKNKRNYWHRLDNLVVVPNYSYYSKRYNKKIDVPTYYRRKNK